MEPKPEKGLLLVAEPTLAGDLAFSRAVVLLADHTENGSVGFILNKMLDFSMNVLVPAIPDDFKVYNGGPVEQDNLFFIHKVPDLIPGSLEISDGIYWGGDFEVVKELISLERISKKEIRFFLGYSGWDREQLNQELQANVWIPLPMENPQRLIERPDFNFWKEKMKSLGGDYLIWANSPEHPSYN